MNVDPDSLTARGLSNYVQSVAATMSVPGHAVHHEVSELSSAYLALHRRSPVFPELDLMLLWDERHGWSVALETAPADDPVVLAYLGGDVLAEADDVHRFAVDVIAGNCPGQLDPPPALDSEQTEELVWRLAARGEDEVAA